MHFSVLGCLLGEEVYPGNLQVRVSFRLSEENRLLICYEADTDQDTVVNLTNHSYFNLSGGGTILDHELQIFASRFTENDSSCLPTGRLLNVEQMGNRLYINTVHNNNEMYYCMNMINLAQNRVTRNRSDNYLTLNFLLLI